MKPIVCLLQWTLTQLLLLLPAVLSIIYGEPWTVQNLYNQAVVYIRFDYGTVNESWRASTGTLLSSTFVLTAGRVFTL